MPIQLTPAQALQKLKHYCAYQERCHAEVKEKLYSFGLFTKDVEHIITTLIEENYLNEERFACAFAGGKFRMKKWGRVKITYELKQKQISTYILKKALKEIDEDEYLVVLQKLATEALKKYSSGKMILRKLKAKQYLMQKGYEGSLITEALNKL